MTTASLVIDPRLRARRTAVLRAEGRRRLRLFLIVMFLFVLVAGAWGLSRSPVLDVDRVAISGVHAEIHELIRSTAGVERGVPLLDVDTEEAERALVDLPWIESAHVHREWPGTLRIDVVPRVAAAVVPAGDGERALIDAGGFVIGPEPIVGSVRVADLTMIDVPLDVAVGDVHVGAASGLAVVAALPDDLLPWVEAVTAEPDVGVGLDLHGGAIVVMGEPARLDDKLAAVRSVLAGVELECLMTINVTMADLTTVARQPSCSPPQPNVLVSSDEADDGG